MDVLTELNIPDLLPPRRGKVRDIFDLGDRLLFVATDRISAFDCILPTGIPDKGRVLCQLSTWWFRKLGHILPHHVIETDVTRFPSAFASHADVLRGRSMLVRKTEVLPIECIARGYLIGSGWKEYQACGKASGVQLRKGYRLADKLDEPIFTPARKAETGHDENIPFDRVAEMVGARRAEQLRDFTLTLYRQAADFALGHGIIIADTKFEFGLIGDELILIDEALTPDSSRFWPVAGYRPGLSPPSFDKQYVRDYLESLAWDKRPPAPPLPADVVEKTRAKYLEAYRIITGASLA